MTNKNLILFSFILLKFILQYSLISSAYDLHRDEYLHLDQGKHIAWGFISVPPFTSWISYLISILGNSFFWIKFFPALFGALTVWISWKTIEVLGGNLFALILGSLAIVFSVITRINILFQPNSFDIFIWCLIYFAIIKYITTNARQWLYIAGIAFAIGFLNKYNVVFCLLGLLPALLLSGHRKLFLNKHFYFAAIISLLIILPNLIWQYDNDFPVIHHMKELADTQLKNINRWDFLKEQLLFFMGGIYLIVAALFSFFLYDPHKKFNFLFGTFFFTLAVFIFFKAKGYYAIGLYPVYISFGAVYVEYLLNKGWRRYLKPVLILIMFLFFIPFANIAFPNKTPQEIQENSQRFKDLGLLRWEDGKDHSLPQDFADMLGWKELALKVDSAYSMADQQHTLVLCDNYGQVGAINYYSKYKNINAISFNADYVNWFPEGKNILEIIRIKELRNRQYQTEERILFQDVKVFDTIKNRFAREAGTTIFLLKNPTTDIDSVISEKLKAAKDYR